MHWISLFRTDLQPLGESAEAHLLAQLSPHILQALVLNRMTHLARDARADSGNKGLAITDLSGMVHHASPAFDAMLRAEWGHWCGGLLPGALLAHFLLGHECFKGRSLVVSRRLEQGFLFLATRPLSRADSLTSREQAIAKLIATGASYKKIALQLERSPATVRNHIQAIYDKLGVNNIAGLIEEMRLGD
jgi:DNA-binding CsgD family transcriptional regulator